jgi:hypothetical protein
LFHREPLLVVTTGKAENVTFVFITEEVTFDFGGQTLVVQSAQLLLVLNLDCFLAPRCGVRDVELHPSQGSQKKENKYFLLFFFFSEKIAKETSDAAVLIPWTLC